MRRNELMPPPVQQKFAFARTDVWQHLPATVRDECLRLIVQQLKECLESESRQEHPDERKDSP